MVEAVNILCYARKIIDDRNLSLLLRGFNEWERGASDITPFEAFENTLKSSSAFIANDEDFDEIMCDLIMFKPPTLVQGVLDILASQYSSASIMLENLKEVQFLVSQKNERKYKLIHQILTQLESNAETQEV